jgi:hypothetical protein
VDRTKTSWTSADIRFAQGLIGLVLIALWWPIAWLRIRPLSDYYFFPLWLGYVLTIDGLVEMRTGTSLWRRSRARFVVLFLISVPFWWVFEVLNRFLENWHYNSPAHYSTVVYVALASLAFSTVVPAVLESAELINSFHVGYWANRLPVLRLRPPVLVAFHLLGWVMIVLIVVIPRYAFPLAWLSVYFIIEPINVALGQRSSGTLAREGHWRPILNVMLGALMTGFFWEMWNVNSIPKWTYTVPFVGFAHLFEMPILGYLGYLPFGLEILSIFGLGFWLVERRPQQYVRVGDRD